jgi:beta-galactosidase
MRTLLKEPYVPFGTQYYRAPSPPPTEWERDLSDISRRGFTMVKYWVQWRWNAPREDAYSFDDIDRLMDLAHRHGLKVMLNTIVDVAPSWIYRKYRDASMVTLDGRRIGPQVQPHRQIGGLGLCFNHEPAMRHMGDFMRETVQRYTGHPALAMWNVASEPELTSSMAEMRLYADDAGRMGDMLCYCARCERRFKEWLEAKYRSIDRLNLSWNRNYAQFDDIELPLTRNSFNDVIDWRMFFVDTLGENVRLRFDIAREADGGAHPLLCHHVFIQGFPVTSTASDPWNVGRFGDLHGFTQMDDPMMCDVLRCSARGKPVISAEMLMQFGYTLDLSKPSDANDVKRYVFTGVGANLKGFIYWQYRPETLAREAPAWGLTLLDGSPTPLLEAFTDVGNVLQRNTDILLDGAPAPARVALLYDPENQVFGWAATGNEKTVTDSLLGTHRALYENNFTVDFVHPREIDAALLGKYSVLYVPFPYLVQEAVAALLRDWVRAGGVLIGECYFAGWNRGTGSHQTTIPGYGLHEVFQARQGEVGAPDESGSVDIVVTGDIPVCRAGTRIRGAIVRATLLPEGAAVLATYPDGAAAVTAARFGDGRAILIGSYIGLPVHRTGHASNAGLISGLVDLHAHIPRPQVGGNARIRVDLLVSPARALMLILRNLEDGEVSADIRLGLDREARLTEQFTGEVVQLTKTSPGSELSVRLRPREVKVFCG